MDLKDILMTLTNTYGGSGNEFEASRAAAELLKPHMDAVEIDGFGNVTGLRACGRPGAKRVLFDAHIDQMAMKAVNVEESGFVRLSAQGFDPRQIYGADVVIKTHGGETIEGVVTTLPAELQSGDRQATVKIADIAVDTGLPAQEVRRRVSVGDYVYFANETMFLAGDMFCGRAMDDRAGVAAIIDAAARLDGEALAHDFCVSFTAREEVGGPGAALVGWRMKPDLTVAIDGGHGRCYAESGPQTHPMDAGCLIGYGDHSVARYADRLIAVAEKYGIPYVKNLIPAHSKTNAGRFQGAAEGLATAVVEFPMIYAHSSVEMTGCANLRHISELVYRFMTDETSMREVEADA